jgi:hypothetical protein
MPRLASYRGGGFTSVDLGGSWWRLQLAAVPSTRSAGLGLVFRYPPAMPIAANAGQWVAMAEYAQLALAVADIALAESVDDLKPLAAVAIASGDRDKDVARATEALNLFRNLPRVKEETMDMITKEVIAVVDGYWQLQRWHRGGCVDRLEVVVADAVIVGTP